MDRGGAEDAGGRLPVKDDNEAAAHFNRRTLCFFSRAGHIEYSRPGTPAAAERE